MGRSNEPGLLKKVGEKLPRESLFMFQLVLAGPSTMSIVRQYLILTNGFSPGINALSSRPLLGAPWDLGMLRLCFRLNLFRLCDIYLFKKDRC